MAAVTGLHRKSLLRLLQGPTLERAPRRPRLRRRRYGAAVADVVRVVWESLDYVCAERLTPVLLPTAQSASGGARWEELVLTEQVAEQLTTISRATVQRLLQRFQQDKPKLPRRKPQPPNPPQADCARCPWNASPGTSRRQAVSRPTWCTTAAPSLLGSMSTPCNWWTSPRAGVSEWSA
jgi:hypothetical protein